MRKEQFEKIVVLFPSDLGKEIVLYHNMGGQLEPAFTNWVFRTKEHTIKSFDDYVRSKGSGHRVLSEEEYNKLS